MAYHGRRVTAGDTDYGELGVNQQRATVFNAINQNGWGHTLGFYGGGVSGQPNPTIRVAIWDTDISNIPDDLIGYTTTINVTGDMASNTTGAPYTSAVTNASESLASNAVKLTSGRKYVIGIINTGGLARFGMMQAYRFNADNKNLYTKNSVTFPTDPFNYDTSPYEGHMDVWLEFQPNRTPTAVISAPTGTITATAPTFSGGFTDPDTAYGDRMTRFRIQVVRVSDSNLMWDSGTLTTTAGEKTLNFFSRAYGGSTLTAGVAYQWRLQVADEFQTWSSWSSYSAFTINGGGIVTPLTPSGKVNTQQPTPFTGTWSHASALAMTHVQVRIKQGNTIIGTGAEVAKAVSNGGSISTTWAEQFSASALGWGTDYTFEMRGKDSSTLWSNWSVGKAFSTNNPPDVPFNLSPKNSQPGSARPLLVAQASDADGDTVTVKARIKNAAGTVLQTRTMTYDATLFSGLGGYKYQTLNTDLATFATYKWDAYSYDGSLYSGSTTVEASATKSTEAAFIYGDGPTVTITAPSTTVTVSNPTVTWTATGQVKYQVVLKQDTTTVYDSGLITSATQSHVIPGGNIRQGEDYDLTVAVTNSAPLTGTSSILTFTVDYPAPDSILNFTADPEYQQFDLSPSSIRLHWDESTDPNFAEYMIVRSGDGHDTIMAQITSSSQTVFIDYVPVSDIEYTYSIVQATLNGLDLLVSDAVEAQAMVELQHVVLNDVTDGNARVGLHFDSGRGIQYNDDLVLQHPWGQRAPTAIYGTAQFLTFDGEFSLATDDQGAARDYIEALRSLWTNRATVCYRDERGRKFFGKIRKFSETDKRIQTYTVKIELVEVGHHEGEH